MPSNPDFKDLFAAFNAEQVEFLLIGAHAVMVYTEPRYTKDLDVLVRPTADNAARVFRALAAFGAPMHDVTPDDFSTPGTVFQIGVEPNRIDVLTSIPAVTFEEAWPRRLQMKYDDEAISVMGLDDLLANKRAVGRPHDLLDATKLERARARRQS
jgi:hypothetical protein